MLSLPTVQYMKVVVVVVVMEILGHNWSEHIRMIYPQMSANHLENPIANHLENFCCSIQYLHRLVLAMVLPLRHSTDQWYISIVIDLPSFSLSCYTGIDIDMADCPLMSARTQ